MYMNFGMIRFTLFHW